jgi:hypothetical protein
LRLRWKRFTQFVGLLLLSAALSVPVLNVVVDPFDVFQTGILPSGSTLNERVNKSRHVLGSSRKYDSMIFGSSMAGVIDPAVLPGSRTSYNFSYFSATPGDVLKTLEMLERGDRLPAHIYIGLDPFMFMAPVPGAPQMRMPPAAGDTAWWPFWRDYLFAASFSSLIAKLKESSREVPRIAFELATGAYRMPWDDHKIRVDPLEFARVNVQGWRIPLRPGWWHGPAETDLTRLVRWTRERSGLKVTWFLEPLHRRLLHALGDERCVYVQKVFAAVGPALIDLSRHSIGNDDLQWYEPKHFRPEAAQIWVPVLGQRASIDAGIASTCSNSP